MTIWTDELTELARANYKPEVSPADFLSIVGKTKDAAKMHLKYIDNPVVRARMAERKAAYKRTNEAYRAKLAGKKVPDRTVPPPEVIEDAIRRAMAPRSLTAILMGDPGPGQSALERRA